MVESFTTRLVRLLAPKFISELEEKAKDREIEVNQRVAEIINGMDPYEPYMRRFRGVFSEEFDHPEEKLNEASRIRMLMWGYQQDTDPMFKHVTDWIINTQANGSIKRKPITTEEIYYCRAKITSVIQLRDEVRRLGNLYRDHLDKMEEDGEVDIGTTVE